MVTDRERVAATGGSATSQADWLPERQWVPNRAVAWTIRALIFVFPLVASWTAVAVLSRTISKPPDQVMLSAWLFLLIGAAFGAAILADHVIRRLAPVPLLYRLTLVFPDTAPSKFKIALRTMTGRDLEKAANSGTAHQRLMTPQQAAENLLVLVAKLSAHDRVTRGHSERVRAYSLLLGKEIGLGPADLAKLQWAALIHDIGKLEVPAEILNKPDAPDPHEWAQIRRHPAAASEYVAILRLWLGDWVDAATQHHERYDGKGYPQGLAGKDISLAGRLVAITDAFDTMTAARSYRPALPMEQARAELLANAGTQFDPDLVKAFMRVSIRQPRGLHGPLAFFAHFPGMLHAPLAVAASGANTVIAGVVATIAATGLAFQPSEPPDFRLAELDVDNLAYTDRDQDRHPVAMPDIATVSRGASVTIPVLTNDVFPQTPLMAWTLAVASPPEQGSASLHGGDIRYDAPDVTGTFTFRYQICDGAGSCAGTEVYVTVTDG